MKLLTPLVAFSLVSLLPLRAENSAVRMAVEQSNKTEMKDKKKPHEKVQVRSLKVSLENGSAAALDGLVVKYWFIGHGVTERALKVVAEGERKSSIAPRGKDVVESEVVSKSFSEESYDAKAKKKVPASGEKISGYAVRVLQGDKVLAESYSEPSYKALIEKPAEAAPAAVAPGAKPPKK